MVERVNGPPLEVELSPSMKKFVDALVEDNKPNLWTVRKYLKRVSVDVGYSPSAVDKLRKEERIWIAAKALVNKRPITIIVTTGTNRQQAGDVQARKPFEPLPSEREERFCQQLIADIHWDRRRAARRAGYGESGVYGLELYKKQYIKERIKELTEERRKRLQADQDDIMRQLILIANTNMDDFVTRFDGGVVQFEDSRLLGRDKMYAIREIKQTIRGVGQNQTENFTIKLQDQMKAISLLAKHFGIVDSLSSTDPAEYVQGLREAAKGIGNKVPGGEV